MAEQHIFRAIKDRDYFCAKNEAFQNRELSLAARGLLAYILSKPDDWIVRNNDLYRCSPAGKYAIKGMIRELKNHYYMRRIQERDPDTQQIRYVTEVYEVQRLNPDFPDHGAVDQKPDHGAVDQLAVDGSPVDGKPDHILSTDSQSTDLQSTEKNNATQSANAASSVQEKEKPEPATRLNGSTPTTLSGWLLMIESTKNPVTVLGEMAIHVLELDAGGKKEKAIFGRIAGIYGREFNKDAVFMAHKIWGTASAGVVGDKLNYLSKSNSSNGYSGQQSTTVQHTPEEQQRINALKAQLKAQTPAQA